MALLIIALHIDTHMHATVIDIEIYTYNSITPVGFQ